MRDMAGLELKGYQYTALGRGRDYDSTGNVGSLYFSTGLGGNTYPKSRSATTETVS